MISRLPTFLVRTPVWIGLGLFAFYLGFAYLLFPPLAKWGAETYIADKTGHSLQLGEVRFDPLRLSLRLTHVRLSDPDRQPLLALGEVHADFEASSLLHWAYTLREFRVVDPDLNLVLGPDGRLNWSDFIAAFDDQEDEEDSQLPRMMLDHVSVRGGRARFVDRMVEGGFETTVAPLDLELTDLSTLPRDKGAYTLSTRAKVGARIRWKGELALNPILATGELAIDEMPLAKVWPYLGERVRVAPPEGMAAVAFKYQAGYARKTASLRLEDMALSLEKLVLAGQGAREAAIRLDHLAARGGRFDLGERRFDLGELVVSGGYIRLRRAANGDLDIQDWFPAQVSPRQRRSSSPSPAPAPVNRGSAWRFGIARVGLQGVSARLLDEGYVAPLALASDQVGVRFRMAAEVGGEAPSVQIDELQIGIEGTRLSGGNEGAEPFAVIRGIALEDGKVDVTGRQFQASRLEVDETRVALRRAGDGRIDLIEAFRRQSGKETGERLAKVVAQNVVDWGYRIDVIAVRGMQASLQDDRVRPPARLEAGIDAQIQGFSQDMTRPLPFQLGARIVQGGRIDVSGRVTPANAALDARVKLADLRLEPAQPYIEQHLNLRLASGRVSSAGRLRHARTLAYTGDFAVDDLRLDDSRSGEPFLTWRHVGSESLRLGLDGLGIGELAVDGVAARLMIHPDKHTNLADLLKPTPAAPATPVNGSGVVGAEPAGFGVTIDHIRVKDSELDFADLSLALPFATRVHQLNGFMSGVSTRPHATPAQLELEGRVDDYGLARAAGQVELLDPTAHMDIKTTFRNVEMTRLTPYSGTFAGRRIASGKLSLDLEYKIDKRQLQGENQIIMDKLTLGERIEAPGARDLPLDLAIAILSDSNGRIDLDLPVAGSLDDPEFSYGRIIWKALVNVIGKIATAPFRALAGVLGIQADKLEALGFDPGSARLQPPERETLKLLAQALAKRPQLNLSVTGTYDPVVDRASLRERQLRLTLARQRGIKLAETEAPPPVSLASPGARAAIEDLYRQRLGKPALEQTKTDFYQANPAQQAATDKWLARLSGPFKAKVEPASAETLQALKGADLHEVLYRQLLDTETVTDASLVALARQRSAAIIDELAGAQQLARDRLDAAPPEASPGGGPRVVAKLALGARPTATPAPAMTPSPSPPAP